MWHEGANLFGGVPNFINAAGMMLMNVVAGYGGVRVDLGEDANRTNTTTGDGGDHHHHPGTTAALLLRRPRPPPNCTKLILRRVHFRGCRFNIEATAQTWSIVLDEPAPAGVVPQLLLDDGAGTRRYTLNSSLAIRSPGGTGGKVVVVQGGWSR